MHVAIIKSMRQYDLLTLAQDLIIKYNQQFTFFFSSSTLMIFNQLSKFYKIMKHLQSFVI